MASYWGMPYVMKGVLMLSATGALLLLGALSLLCAITLLRGAWPSALLLLLSMLCSVAAYGWLYFNLIGCC